MLAALDEAKKAAEKDEVPVGAVVVREGRIIARGHNLSEEKNNPLCHGELVALNRAIEQLGKKQLFDCTLYVTLEPCPMCMGALLHAKTGAVVFGAYDERTGAAGTVLNLNNTEYFRKARILGGYMEKECSALLTDFFAKKRKNQP